MYEGSMDEHDGTKRYVHDYAEGEEEPGSNGNEHSAFNGAEGIENIRSNEMDDRSLNEQNEVRICDDENPGSNVNDN